MISEIAVSFIQQGFLLFRSITREEWRRFVLYELSCEKFWFGFEAWKMELIPPPTNKLLKVDRTEYKLFEDITTDYHF